MAAAARPAERLITFGEIFPKVNQPFDSYYRLERELSPASIELGERFFIQIKDKVGGEAQFNDLIRKVCEYWEMTRVRFDSLPMKHKLLNVMYYQMQAVASNEDKDRFGKTNPSSENFFQAVAIPSTADMFKAPTTPAMVRQVRVLLEIFKNQLKIYETITPEELDELEDEEIRKTKEAITGMGSLVMSGMWAKLLGAN